MAEGENQRIVIALAGDTMLGRGAVARIMQDDDLFSDEVHALVRRADCFILNLECCISNGGRMWPDPRKPFFFRAPPKAVDILARLGVDCVTLANNHSLDFNTSALLDTLEHLDRAGIVVAGAGVDLEAARAPAIVSAGPMTVAVIGVTDHPAGFAAAATNPGVAYADLKQGVPDWVLDLVDRTEADVILVTPHWGPNMVAEPVPHVQRAAETLRRSRATLVAGHSAHVVHGAHDRVLFDMGDFVDDYAVDPQMRNDLGMFFLVTTEGGRPTLLEAVPLKLEYCFTRLATGMDAEKVARRFLEASRSMGSDAWQSGGRVFVRFD